MTSSMPAPRIDLGEDSPITQRIASSTLDLPQPFGPTTPVRPSSMRSSAGSTKLLKPVSFSLFIRIAAPGASPGPASSADRVPQGRLETGPAYGIGYFRAVDEKGRRAAHPFDLGRPPGDRHERVERAPIGEAGRNPRLAHAARAEELV